MPPREGRHRREGQGAFRRAGIHTGPEDCSSVHAWTGAPSRRLRGGIARGLARLCFRFATPASDEESVGTGSTDRTNREPKPREEQPVAAPVTASTTESARGQMCRELHGPFLVRITNRRNTKNARTMLFFIHLLPTGLSTACPPPRSVLAAFPGLLAGPVRVAMTWIVVEVRIDCRE